MVVSQDEIAIISLVCVLLVIMPCIIKCCCDCCEFVHNVDSSDEEQGGLVNPISDGYYGT